MGVGNVSRVQVDDLPRQINSIFIIGDTKKEIELDVAPGFPQIELDENEIMLPYAFAEYFGIDSEPKKVIADEAAKVNMTFDLLSLFSDQQKVKKIFLEESQSSKRAKSNIKNITRGELMLDYMHLPRETMFFEFMASNGMGHLLSNPAVQVNLERSGIDKHTKLYTVINIAFKRIKRSDLIFTKEYRVKGTFLKPLGKWQDSLAESAFLDSTKFFQLYSKIFFDRILAVMKREREENQKQGLEEILDLQEYQMTAAFFQAMQLAVENTDSKQFALTANIKTEKSQERYFNNTNWAPETINLWMKDPLQRSLLESKYKITAPVSSSLDIMMAL